MDRAISNVVGIVLILAITLATVTTLMVIGAFAVEEAKEDAEIARMETSMAQMSSKASLTALGNSEATGFDLGRLGDGSLVTQENAGSVTVEYVRGTNTTIELFHSDAFGALVYERGDREVAYQGGGVWTRSGEGGGEMISPPEYHYVGETLTFPIVTVSGDGRSGALGTGELRHQRSESHFPTADLFNPVENATILVEIKSQYHRGWYDFFEERTEGDVFHDPPNRTVRAELTATFHDDFMGVVAAGEDYNIHRNMDDSGFYEDVEYPSVSSYIENEVDNCAGEFESFPGAGTYADERYCWEDEVELSETLTFDTSGGDINVVIPEGIDFSGQTVTVTGGNRTYFHVQDSVGFGPSDLNVGGDAEHLIAFVHSDVDEIRDSGNFNMNGIVYAPNTHVDLGGAVDFDGTIIAESFESRGNAADYSFDESLEDFDLSDFVQADNELHYLHVTENDVEITLD